jgi:hypothetical protein
MNRPPQVKLALRGKEAAAFAVDEATFNPFIRSPESVDIWLELVLRNIGPMSASPPIVELQFDKPIMLRSSSLWGYLSSRQKRYWDPAMGQEYVGIGQMNTAMYSELWNSYVDSLASIDVPKFGSRLRMVPDLFSQVYNAPVRVVSNADLFVQRTNTFLDAAGASCRRVSLSNAQAPYRYCVNALGFGQTGLEIEVNRGADGPCVMRRLPWRSEPAAGGLSCASPFYGLNFVAQPRLRVADTGERWEIRPKALRGRGDSLAPNESLRFWVWWRHPDALKSGLIVAHSAFSDLLTLNYDITFMDGTHCHCLNSFIRVPPQFSLSANREDALAFKPIPYSAEIFSEWRWYSNLLTPTALRFAHEGASQYFSYRLCPGSETVELGVTFIDTLSEPRRLARVLTGTIVIGLLTALWVSWLVKSTEITVSERRPFFPASHWSSGNDLLRGLVALTFLITTLAAVYIYKDYSRTINNPVFRQLKIAHLLRTRPFQARLLGYEESPKGRRRRRSYRAWLSCVGTLILGLWCWALFTYLGLGTQVGDFGAVMCCVVGGSFLLSRRSAALRRSSGEEI